MKWMNIEEIKPGTMLEQDIYSDGNSTVPLLYKGSLISGEYLEKLKERGISAILIKDERLPERVRNRLVDQWKGSADYVPKAEPAIAPELKSEAINSVQDLFSSINEDDVHSSAQIIKNMDSVVEQLVNSIGKDQSTLINISDLRSYDEYTYHHSLSVAVLSIAIGHFTDLNKKDLNELGKSALMHDIGKTLVPIEILHKTSKLSDDEFTVMKGHSAYGYKYLVDRNLGDDKLRGGVVAHHEKVDGTGYPLKLVGDKIPLWGKIISVADVYDALTSNRPYRTPMQPAEAIEYVMGSVGTAFDYDLVKAFVEKVDIYPVGHYIELSNGNTAVILNNSQSNLRPMIRVMETGDTVDLYSDRNYLSVVIKRLIPEDEMNARAI